jgi:hypothetical protein
MATLGLAGLITHWPPNELQPPTANVSGGRAPLQAIAGMGTARWSAAEPPPSGVSTIGGVTVLGIPPPPCKIGHQRRPGDRTTWRRRQRPATTRPATAPQDRARALRPPRAPTPGHQAPATSSPTASRRANSPRCRAPARCRPAARGATRALVRRARRIQRTLPLECDWCTAITARLARIAQRRGDGLGAVWREHVGHECLPGRCPGLICGCPIRGGEKRPKIRCARAKAHAVIRDPRPRPSVRGLDGTHVLQPRA